MEVSLRVSTWYLLDEWIICLVYYLVGFPGGSVVNNATGDMGSIPGLGRFHGLGRRKWQPICLHCRRHRRYGFDPWAVKIPWVGKKEMATHLPALQETQEMWVRSLGCEDSVGWEGNGNPLQYTCLENPMDKEPGGLQSIGSQSQKQLKWLNTHTHTHTQFSSYQVGNRSIKTWYSFLLDSID